MGGLSERFNKLTRREKLIAFATALALSLLILMELVWLPMEKDREKLESLIETGLNLQSSLQSQQTVMQKQFESGP